MSASAHRLTRLEDLRDVVEQIRRASGRNEHDLAGSLNERLALLLSESPEQLLKTRELADWQHVPERKHEADALAGDALDEIRSEILALGPSASWH
jgi:hypothetical protein